MGMKAYLPATGTKGARLISGARLSLAGLALAGAATAQAPNGQPADGSTIVSWAVTPVDAPRHGRKTVINVRGSIREGWHVYALKQSSTGPTPLVVAVEQNAVAFADGAPQGSPPTVAFEPAFGFVTPFYARSFNLTVPVRLRPGLASGRQLVPVSIRYQSCDGRICFPPRTVHLTAPVDIGADS